MKSRISLLTGAVLASAMALLAACAGAPDKHAPCTVAVWELEHLNPQNAIAADMGALLADRIVDTFHRSTRCTPIERQKLVLALEELNLGSSELADDTTRLRIGRILGAGYMVFGAFQQLGSVIRLDIRLVDVSTGTVVQTATQTAAQGNIADWLQAAEKAAFSLESAF